MLSMDKGGGNAYGYYEKESESIRRVAHLPPSSFTHTRDVANNSAGFTADPYRFGIANNSPGFSDEMHHMGTANNMPGFSDDVYRAGVANSSPGFSGEMHRTGASHNMPGFSDEVYRSSVANGSPGFSGGMYRSAQVAGDGFEAPPKEVQKPGSMQTAKRINGAQPPTQWVRHSRSHSPPHHQGTLGAPRPEHASWAPTPPLANGSIGSIGSASSIGGRGPPRGFLRMR